MKINSHHASLVRSKPPNYLGLAALALSLPLASCVVADHGRYGHGHQVTTVGVGVGYYDSLPPSFDQPYYSHGNRYYYGGSWEQGRFFHEGRYHEGRYVHNGQYYYGGKYPTSHSKSSGSNHRNHDQDHDRH